MNSSKENQITPLSILPFHPYETDHLLPLYGSSSEKSPTHSESIQETRWKSSVTRWWILLGLVLLVFVGIQAVIFISGTIFFWTRPPSPSPTVSENYRPIIYHHLNSSQPINIPSGTTVYHVTREYGPASLGRIGPAVNSLVMAQMQRPELDISVIMPHYGFLRSHFEGEMRRVTELTIEVRDRYGMPRPVEFKVYEVAYNPLTGHGIPIANVTDVDSDPDPELKPKTIHLYLISSADVPPFRQAFKVKDISKIYSSTAQLPVEWKDHYFAKAVATFLNFKHMIDDGPLFDITTRHTVDVVHIHGTVNAYVAKYLKDEAKSTAQASAGRPIAPPPAVIYTMHDIRYDMQHANHLENIEKFADDLSEEQREELTRHARGHHVFTAPIAIENSELVTAASRTLADDLINGRLDLRHKDAVLPVLRQCTLAGRFFGISNGMDLSRLNPFTASQLMARQMEYPHEVLDHELAKLLYADSIPHEPSRMKTITQAKNKAKEFLLRRKLLKQEDLRRPIVLFAGWIDAGGGDLVAQLETAAPALAALDTRFVIMAHVMNGDGRAPPALDTLHRLEREHPDHILVVAESDRQRRWGIFLRAAADIAFAPAISPVSTGVGAAEGLLFGCPVIGTNVGGQRDFLIDREVPRKPPSEMPSPLRWKHNAYLYDPREPNAREALELAIRDAILDHRLLASLPGQDRNLRAARMVKSALSSLGWHRAGGPLEDYLRVYELGLKAVARVKDPEDKVNEAQSGLVTDEKKPALLFQPPVVWPTPIVNEQVISRSDWNDEVLAMNEEVNEEEESKVTEDEVARETATLNAERAASYKIEAKVKNPWETRPTMLSKERVSAPVVPGPTHRQYFRPMPLEVEWQYEEPVVGGIERPYYGSYKRIPDGREEERGEKAILTDDETELEEEEMGEEEEEDLREENGMLEGGEGDGEDEWEYDFGEPGEDEEGEEEVEEEEEGEGIEGIEEEYVIGEEKNV
ncbi:uncharacterized protein VTP21DRAFT_10026 [Calcarisporiella thermophila]|uniref:uncharacterized protein n=1 Tax=Calcarisporiella thermophila TaxID=911321 RepID=UPI003741EA46